MKSMLERIAIWCALALAGCNAAPQVQRGPTPPPGMTPNGNGNGNGNGGGMPQPTPIPITYSGIYAVPTPLDLTQNGVLPGMVGPALAALIELHDHPGDSILKLVVAAQIPSVSDAVSGLPTLVRDILASLLDKLIVDEVYDNAPVVERVAGIVSGLTELTRTMTLDNHLTVHAPDANGAATMELQTIAVDFTLLGKQTRIPFDLRELGMAHATLSGKVVPRATAPAADADLTLAGGTMTLPFGELVMQAATPLVFAPLGGTDLDGTLRNLVRCHDAAQSISDGIDNVLSAATIEQICTTAIDSVANGVTQAIDDIVLHDVRIADASGYLLDVSVARPQIDHQSDRIAQGHWSWTFGIAGHDVTVPSTLEGERIGDVP